MGIEPVTAGLIGACLMACWPCLVPCCLSMALLPIPIIIIRQANTCRKCPKCPSPCNVPQPTEPTNTFCWYKFQRTAGNPNSNGEFYNIHWSDSGIKYVQLDRHSVLSN